MRTPKVRGTNTRVRGVLTCRPGGRDGLRAEVKEEAEAPGRRDVVDPQLGRACRVDGLLGREHDQLVLGPVVREGDVLGGDGVAVASCSRCDVAHLFVGGALDAFLIAGQAAATRLPRSSRGPG